MTESAQPQPITWNPLKPESVLRSQRVQGALLTAASLALLAKGVYVDEQTLTTALEGVNSILLGVGVLVHQVGAIRAQRSPRPF